MKRDHFQAYTVRRIYKLYFYASKKNIYIIFLKLVVLHIYSLAYFICHLLNIVKAYIAFYYLHQILFFTIYGQHSQTKKNSFFFYLLFNSIKLSQCSKLYNSRLQKLHLLLNSYCKFPSFFFPSQIYTLSCHSSPDWPFGNLPPDWPDRPDRRAQALGNMNKLIILLTTLQFSPNICLCTYKFQSLVSK